MKIITTAKYHLVTTKFQCEQCKNFTYFTKGELNRRGIPRCRFCGSTYLEPVTEQGKNRIVENLDESRRRMDVTREKMNYEKKDPVV